jgi:DNA modification methylase
MPVSRNWAAAEPYWKSDCGRAVVHVGDNLPIMLRMERNQFHAVVTDPPYGLEFMGKEWDAPWKNDGKIEVCDEGTDVSHPFRDGTQRVCYGSDSKLFQQWFFDRATKMLRVSRPGAHLLSFGGTRMWHRMTCAVEDAGWEVRDTLMWVYGSGFPKGKNIGKDIDRVLGAKGEVVGEGRAKLAQGQFNASEVGAGGYGYKAEYDVTRPVTEAGRKWEGWNTALKPAWEPILLARKEPVGSVARNVLEHGCGGINVDGCRVGDSGCTTSVGEPNHLNKVYGDGMGGLDIVDAGKGRWPTNVIHDGSDEVVELFPETGPTRPDARSGGSMDPTGKSWGFKRTPSSLSDQGGSAARFFYTAKADKTDRPHGKGTTLHPTVKPLDLMRYLIRLVCVPGGLLLDPFMGSGSTGCAALLEGCRFVGIEQSQEYADIAVGRLRLALDEAGPPRGNEWTGVKRVATETPPPPKRVR